MLQITQRKCGAKGRQSPFIYILGFDNYQKHIQFDKVSWSLLNDFKYICFKERQTDLIWLKQGKLK